MVEYLSPEGGAILKVVVDHIRGGNVDPNRPETFISYKEIHDLLNLSLMGDTYGNSLSNQGLEDLVDWANKNGFPAITGLIINKTTSTPGKGYFEWFGRDEYDFGWWKNQMKQSLEFNWDEYL